VRGRDADSTQAYLALGTLSPTAAVPVHAPLGRPPFRRRRAGRGGPTPWARHTATSNQLARSVSINSSFASATKQHEL
jgi:hypothetical protein